MQPGKTTFFGWVALILIVLVGFGFIFHELFEADNQMSGHGIAAFIIGAVGTAAVGAVLMWLLFRSNPDR